MIKSNTELLPLILYYGNYDMLVNLLRSLLCKHIPLHVHKTYEQKKRNENKKHKCKIENNDMKFYY